MGGRGRCVCGGGGGGLLLHAYSKKRQYHHIEFETSFHPGDV